MPDSPIDDYFESHRQESSLADVDLSSDDLLGRAVRGVQEALRRLHALPPSDPFWKNTNGKATLFKVDVYSSTVVARDPHDVDAWWCRIGLDLWHCANEFGSDGFRAFHALGLLEPEWPAQAALHVFLNSGFDTSDRIARLASELGIERQTRLALAEIARHHPSAKEWVGQVLRVLV